MYRNLESDGNLRVVIRSSNARASASACILSDRSGAANLTNSGAPKRAHSVDTKKRARLSFKNFVEQFLEKVKIPD